MLFIKLSFKTTVINITTHTRGNTIMMYLQLGHTVMDHQLVNGPSKIRPDDN